MKKLLTICLILTTLLASFSLVPAAEDAPAADPLAENLIIHYDFEGDDIETQLKDKATGKTFSFANTHTDHASEEAREKGMLRLRTRMTAELRQEAVQALKGG